MYHGVESPYELILWNLSIEKTGFYEMFYVSEWPREIIIGVLNVLKCYIFKFN
jgi:hypothetical protein